MPDSGRWREMMTPTHIVHPRVVITTFETFRTKIKDTFKIRMLWRCLNIHQSTRNFRRLYCRVKGIFGSHCRPWLFELKGLKNYTSHSKTRMHQIQISSLQSNIEVDMDLMSLIFICLICLIYSLNLLNHTWKYPLQFSLQSLFWSDVNRQFAFLPLVRFSSFSKYSD